MNEWGVLGRWGAERDLFVSGANGKITPVRFRAKQLNQVPPVGLDVNNTSVSTWLKCDKGLLDTRLLCWAAGRKSVISQRAATLLTGGAPFFRFWKIRKSGGGDNVHVTRCIRRLMIRTSWDLQQGTTPPSGGILEQIGLMRILLNEI